MKYKFIEKSLDEYVLEYTNYKGIEKSIPFKRTVELAKKIQGADAEARIKLYSYLTEIGKTKQDFIIRTTKDGKIIEDESNYRELESQFIEQEQLKLAIEVYSTLFNMGIADLLEDMNAKDQKEVEQFSLELREILINGKVKTPSVQEIKEQ